MVKRQLIAALALVCTVLAGVAGTARAAQEPYCTYLADRHVARGINCDTCHDASLKLKTIGGRDICVSCHGDFEQMKVKTAGRYAKNPHAPHEQGVTCTSCHKGHKAPENNCAKCHQVQFKVP